MSKNELKPAIRFAGFTDAWEQRKLGNWLEEYTEKTTINNQYPALTSSRRGLFFQTDYFDGHQIASQNNIGYNIVPRNYFTYRHMSDDEIFYFNINNLCDFGIVSTLYPVFTTKIGLDSKYLQYQLNNGEEFRKFAILQKQGGSRTYMYLSKLKELTITVPTNCKEQERISELLCYTDNLITLHQRKYDKLVAMKKSLLEKMFPNDNLLLPDIRFKGYTEAWEQHKCSEISKRYDNLRIPVAESKRISGNIPYYGANGIQDYVSGFTHDGEFVLIAEDGANDLKNYPVQYVNGQIWVNNHAHVLQSTPENSTLFLKYLINSSDIESVLVGGGRAKLNANVLMDLIFSLPRKTEQVNIANLLYKVEEVITLHQRKCEKLKNLKKSLLEKIFC